MKIGKNGEENGEDISLNDRRMKKLKHMGISEWTCRVIVEWVRR